MKVQMFYGLASGIACIGNHAKPVGRDMKFFGQLRYHFTRNVRDKVFISGLYLQEAGNVFFWERSIHAPAPAVQDP